MKKIFNIFVLGLLLVTTSCEKSLEVFSDTTCRLNFYYREAEITSNFQPNMAQGSFSFIYSGNIQQDTVWVEVESMGLLADYDRPITIEQVDTTAVMAVAGKHYVPFDDPSLVKYYVMPAGKARTKLPIVVLRDASLKHESVVLKYHIKPNDFFTKGYDVFQTRSLSITDRLAQPAYWTKGYPMYGYYYSLYNFIGYYGVVKHQFMIDITGKPWDDAFIEEFITGDTNYLNYILNKLVSELDKYNAKRQEQGLDVLREEDGTEVNFDSRYDE